MIKNLDLGSTDATDANIKAYQCIRRVQVQFNTADAISFKNQMGSCWSAQGEGAAN